MLRLIRVDGLLVGFLVSSPALWQAFVTGTVDITSALVRFLVAVVVFSLAFHAVGSLVSSYERSQRVAAAARRAAESPRRRRSDG